MDALSFAWLCFAVYLAATSYLAYRGMRKTRDLTGFAIGNRDMGPVLVGLTVAAATASSATFVINPGFVYTHGVSALMHFGVATMGGVIVGLVVMSKGFRRFGTRTSALTLPHWIGARYDSGAMRTYFAVLNLALAVAFVVLIVKGSALVMQQTLHVSYPIAVVIIVGFVFTYILMGGTYAHAYTNAFQGAMMIVVAVVIASSGFDLFSGGTGAFLDRLAAQDPNLVAPINPTSALYGTAWDALVTPFIISFGLVCQPHILTKALYLKSDRAVNRYLTVSGVVMVVFALVLLAGLYARIRYPGLPAQDGVMATYIVKTFSPMVGVLIAVALLAAGMSTMDGILVSASSIAGNDLFLGALGGRLLSGRTPEQRQAAALKASRWILVGMGVAAVVIALDPPKFVGLFAQTTVYGLVAASLAPVVFGIFVAEVDRRDALAAALLGPLVHYGHYAWTAVWHGEMINPAATATEGTIVSFAILIGMTLYRRARRSSASPLAEDTVSGVKLAR